MSTKLVLPIFFALLFVSCEVDPFEETSGKTFDVGSLSKRKLSNTLKDGQHWVEAANGTIYWDENATSQATTKPGETYLGPNVLVGTHNRDSNLNEPINSAKFELYLEKNKEGSSAEIMGNTVPTDVKKYGTLAEGLYPATYRIYNKDGALLINGGRDLPTVNGNPNNPKNYYNDGSLKPNSEHVLDHILFHKGNYGRESLYKLPDEHGYRAPISTGCQTGGSGNGSLPVYRDFIKEAEGFEGNYYLRKP
ncbi:hypothetical protein E6C50_00785 [Flavobacterium supellecticarium]|uniref:Uncharacterized protein n=1 Tax=Flavobacterium supellecticarium TaxID=2565924 RepID=A0A4S4A2Y5_9FLAO|nr:hypothetical protein [Flavobacterium supellecticarium]THF52780.1 hypothetical protein E6C50_00785 [Flavobacterium supellecticarium]